MSDVTEYRAGWATRAGFGVLTATLCSQELRADYEAPNSAYLPSSTYYASATGTGSTLKSQLYTIISSGFKTRSYGDARYWMELTDADPNAAGNILLVYNRASVDGTWDLGVTYNREHLMPEYWLNISNIANTYNGPGSDLFELRPSNPSINSTRSNNAYGTTSIAAPHNYGNTTTGGSTYWYPGDADRGDVARSMFYMATRYGQGQTNNISLVNGAPTALYTMGDLASLLKWNYEDGVDNFERRRNQVIYSSSLNPSYYQGNRNPYIDHPEYVWTIFGTGDNTSKIYVGASATTNGTTSTTVDLGRVIVGATLGSSTVTLQKSGTTPTTYDIATSGEATSTSAGTGQPFSYNAQSRLITVALSSSTATAGAKTGSIVINNTDLTSAGTGQGSADGNDTISVSASVLSHSSASLSSGGVVRALTLDFGTVAQSSTPASLAFGISNLIQTAGFTAGLDLDTVTFSGNSSTLSTNLAAFSALAAGTTRNFSASINTGATGTFAASYVIKTSDENIPGATAGTPLTISLAGSVLVRQWWATASASWSSSNSWLGTVPQTSSDAANFLGTITAPQTVTIASTETVGSMTFDNLNQYTLAGAGSITLNPSAGNANITVVSGSHAINTPLVVARNLDVQVTRSADTLMLSQLQSTAQGITKTGQGVLLVNTVQATSLAVNDGLVKIAASGLSSSVAQVTNLSLAATGRLDLTNNALILPGGGTLNGSAITVSALKAALIAGRGGVGTGGATWNGAGGIGSSAFTLESANSVGYVWNADPDLLILGGITSVNGQPLDSTDYAVKFTLSADANLDGLVDNIDVGIVGLRYESGADRQWYDGDFNYDGVVNNDDVAILGLAYGRSMNDLTSLSSASDALFKAPLALAFDRASIVPEPVTLTWTAVGLLGCLRRRRRARSPV